MRFAPEDINCDGCHANDGQRHFSHCLTCTVRQCGKEKGLDNCASCCEYPCTVLNELHQMIPMGKEVFEQFRSKAE